MRIEHKTFPFEVKDLDEKGRGTGYLSVFGNEDSYGDVVDPGAFAKTIAERSESNPLPLLWQHDSTDPAGIYTKLAEDDHGLYTEFQLAMATQRGRDAYEFVQMRAVKGQSIGFTTIKDVIDAGIRRLKELRLWEGSLVTFPANELAGVDSIKSRDEIEQLKREIAELRKIVVPELPELDELRAVAAEMSALAKGEPRAPQHEPDASTRELLSLAAEFRRQAHEYAR